MIIPNKFDYKIIFFVVGIYVIIILFYLQGFEGDITSLINLGDPYYSGNTTTILRPHFVHRKDKVGYFRGVSGYDGQNYYFIAQNLLGQKVLNREVFEPVDHKEMPFLYRYQRILYPLLVSLCSFGKRELFPFAMLLINIISIIIATIIIIIMLKQQKMNPWYVLFYSFLSGLIFSILRDCSEPLAMCFLVAGFYFYSTKRLFISCILFSLASLTREMLVVVLGFLAIEYFLKRKFKEVLLIVCFLFPFILWQGYLFVKTGQSAIITSFSYHVIPNSFNWGIWMYAKEQFLRVLFNVRDNGVWIYFLLFLIGSILSFIYSLIYLKLGINVLSLSYFCFSLLPFLITSEWSDPLSYCRITLPSIILTILTFIQSKDKILLISIYIHGVLSFLSLSWLLYYRV